VVFFKPSGATVSAILGIALYACGFKIAAPSDFAQRATPDTCSEPKTTLYGWTLPKKPYLIEEIGKTIHTELDL